MVQFYKFVSAPLNLNYSSLPWIQIKYLNFDKDIVLKEAVSNITEINFKLSLEERTKPYKNIFTNISST